MFNLPVKANFDVFFTCPQRGAYLAPRYGHILYCMKVPVQYLYFLDPCFGYFIPGQVWYERSLLVAEDTSPKYIPQHWTASL